MRSMVLQNWPETVSVAWDDEAKLFPLLVAMDADGAILGRMDTLLGATIEDLRVALRAELAIDARADPDLR